MSSDEDLSLSALFLRTLSSASKSLQVPTLDPASQSALQSASADLSLLSSRISSLSLFSKNESVDDLGTKDAAFMLVDFVQAEVIGRLRANERDQRMQRLREAEAHLRSFIARLDDYEIVPDAEKELFAARGGSDPAARRELKMRQYKAEKTLRSNIMTLMPTTSPSSDFDLFAALLSFSNRPLTFLVLRLAHVQAQTQLRSISDELELLRNAPPDPPRAPRETHDEDDSWRLDQMRRSLTDHNGPILDPSGKPLRPFTILPSNNGSVTADRQRIAAQVFRPDHRLPTMTIDEYLAEEQRRGNIITGGGAASQNAPTSEEIITEDSEQDGTAFGEQRGEEKRKKDEEWAVWTEANPKGAGNRMNKG